MAAGRVDNDRTRTNIRLARKISRTQDDPSADDMSDESLQLGTTSSLDVILNLHETAVTADRTAGVPMDQTLAMRHSTSKREHMSCFIHLRLSELC